MTRIGEIGQKNRPIKLVFQSAFHCVMFKKIYEVEISSDLHNCINEGFAILERKIIKEWTDKDEEPVDSKFV